MAGDWLKLRNDLDEDPRVLRVQALLGAADIDLVIGKFRRLWRYADLYTEDGFIPFADAGMIDRVVGAGGFAAAVESVGWLEFRDGGAQIPRFDEHNGRSAKARALNANRQIDFRRRNAGVTVGASQREEKSREEKSKKPPPTPRGGRARAHRSRRKEPTPAEGFEEFWQAYPKRVKRPKAVEEWNRLHPNPELRQRILDAIGHSRASDQQWSREGGRYIPYPANYLSQRGWEDEQMVPATAKGALPGLKAIFASQNKEAKCKKKT